MNCGCAAYIYGLSHERHPIFRYPLGGAPRRTTPAQAATPEEPTVSSAWRLRLVFTVLYVSAYGGIVLDSHLFRHIAHIHLWRQCRTQPKLTLNAIKYLFCCVRLLRGLDRPRIGTAKADFDLNRAVLLVVLVCPFHAVANVLFQRKNGPAC